MPLEHRPEVRTLQHLRIFSIQGIDPLIILRGIVCDPGLCRPWYLRHDRNLASCYDFLDYDIHILFVLIHAMTITPGIVRSQYHADIVPRENGQPLIDVLDPVL